MPNKTLVFMILNTLILVLMLLYVRNINTNGSFKSSTLYVVDKAGRETNKSYAGADDYEVIDFEGYDNNKDKPFDRFIVPNYVHLVYLKLNEIKFYQLVNIYSIFLNQKPARIYIHCDMCEFRGYYWDQLNSIEAIKKILIVNRIPSSEKIFNTQVGWIQHRADVVRLLVLMNYGGIYLDNDVYLINAFDEYRKYEMSISWDNDNDAIGNQVLIANRNARFLRAFFDSYRTNYSSGEWYYNAGWAPANILIKYRYLAHVVREKLGTHMLINNLYKTYWPEWRKLDSIHLLMGHRSYLDKESPIKEFDEDNIKTYNFTYGEMAREALSGMRPYLEAVRSNSKRHRRRR